MRIACLALVPACLYTGDRSEGHWTREPAACAPVTGTVALLHDPGLEHFGVRGDTILYATADGLRELAVATRESRAVAAGYTSGTFGVFAGDLVYFDVEHARPIAVVVDRGGDDPATRYLRVSDPATLEVADLFAIPAGIYWSEDGAGRRWTPAAGATDFALGTRAWVETNGREFAYRSGTDLVLKSATGGDARTITQGMSDVPEAFGDDELYVARSLGSTLVDIIAVGSAPSGAERTVVAAESIRDAVADATHLYWAAGRELRRIPLAGGDSHVFHEAPADTLVESVATDACNVYWTVLDHGGRTLYARAR